MALSIFVDVFVGIFIGLIISVIGFIYAYHEASIAGGISSYQSHYSEHDLVGAIRKSLTPSIKPLLPLSILFSIIFAGLGFTLSGLGHALIGLVSGFAIGFVLSAIYFQPFNLIYILDILFQHTILRYILQKQGFIPMARGPFKYILLGNYASFLDYCSEIGILRKAGGGYIFRHRYFLEHFAQQKLDER